MHQGVNAVSVLSAAGFFLFFIEAENENACVSRFGCMF